jgi:hypothetical protein
MDCSFDAVISALAYESSLPLVSLNGKPFSGLARYAALSKFDFLTCQIRLWQPHVAKGFDCDLPLVSLITLLFIWIYRLKFKQKVKQIMRHYVMCNLFQTK